MDWGWFGRLARKVARGALLRARGIEGKQVRCDWRLALVGADGVERDVVRFQNLIVNAGFDGAKDRLFNPATAVAIFRYIAIGTDGTPETSGDIALLAEVARDAASYTDTGTATCTLAFTFPAGTGTGGIQEVGLLNDPAAGTLFSRHTFAVINKTATDQLKAQCVITLQNA